MEYFDEFALGIVIVIISLFYYLYPKTRRSSAVRVQQGTKNENRKENKTGTQRLVDVLQSHGVKFIFTLTGSDIFPIMVEADNIGIRIIDVRHEAAGVYAAKSVGRMTGRPGIVLVSGGPGVTNTLSGAMDAKDDEVPVIIIGGAPATFERGSGALHETDHLRIMGPVCKKTYSVDSTQQLIPIMKKAFQIAMSGTPGPVFVQITLDAFDENYVTPNYEFRMKPKQWKETVFNFIRGGQSDDQDVTPLPVYVPVAKPKEINKSKIILESAKRPLIVVGTQVTLSPDRLDSVSRALESMGIPCFLNFTAKGLLGKSNNLLIQYDEASVLAASDVVILAGYPTDFFFRFGLDLPKNGKIITVGRNPDTLTLNSPKNWRPTQIVRGDVGRYLVELSKALAKTSFTVRPGWIRKCQAISAEMEKYYMKKANEVTPEGLLNPIKVTFELDKVAPDDVIWATDGGDFTSTGRHILRAPSPLSFIWVGSFGNVGSGIGAAIGIKLCRPDRPVWLVTGDGGIGFHIVEIDPCVRHEIPIMICVANDSGWNEIRRKERDMYGKDTTVGSELAYSDYHKVAIAFGAQGARLDNSNKDGIAMEFEKAQEINKMGSSILVNALIGTTDIREGYA